MHKVLQEIHSAKPLTTAPPEARRLLTKYWEKSAYATLDEEREYFSKGYRALDNYIAETKRSKEETLGTEVYMSLLVDLKTTRVRLGCKADRLAVHPDGSLEIIDYKTTRSGKVPTAESLLEDLPAFLYYVLTRLTYPQYSNITLTYLNVLTMERATIAYEKAIVDKNRQALWDCIKQIAGNQFIPRVNENCCWCEFQDCCPVTGKIIDLEDI